MEGATVLEQAIELGLGEMLVVVGLAANSISAYTTLQTLSFL
jgi:hypothetical protein